MISDHLLYPTTYELRYWSMLYIELKSSEIEHLRLKFVKIDTIFVIFLKFSKSKRCTLLCTH